MYQPHSSSGQPAEPLRPPAPAPVRTAVKLMYAGAAVSAVQLIIGRHAAMARNEPPREPNGSRLGRTDLANSSELWS